MGFLTSAGNSYAGPDLRQSIILPPAKVRPEAVSLLVIPPLSGRITFPRLFPPADFSALRGLLPTDASCAGGPCCTAEFRSSWPPVYVRTGSSAEMLKLSISSPLPPIADAPTPPGTPPWPRRGYRPPGRAGRASARACSFNDLIRAQHDRRRYRKAERRGGLAVHNHLEFRRQLHR